jgi:hypothetical protein
VARLSISDFEFQGVKLGGTSSSVVILRRSIANNLGETSMAKTVADVLAAANQEWNHWGKSVWNLSTGQKHIGHRDDEQSYARYVINNYNAVGGGKPTAQDIMNDHYFWSAVGISFVFHKAQFSANEFPFGERHSTWIRKSVVARQNNDKSALYHAYRLHEPQATPDVGDMVGYTYANVSFQAAQKYYDKTTGYQSHTDVVVAKEGDSIDVIGFNVMDSVTRKTIPLTNTGHIADRSHKWFVVMKRMNLH